MASGGLLTASRAEPSVPITLRLKLGPLCALTQLGVGRILVSHLRSHLCGVMATTCDDPCCVYLCWFLQHHQNCQLKENCSSCGKLLNWISLHTESCEVDVSCPLGAICKEIKTKNFKSYIKTFNPELIEEMKNGVRNSSSFSRASSYGSNGSSEPSENSLGRCSRVDVSWNQKSGAEVRSGATAWNQNEGYSSRNGRYSQQNGAMDVQNGSYSQWNGMESSVNGMHARPNGIESVKNGGADQRNGMEPQRSPQRNRKGASQNESYSQKRTDSLSNGNSLNGYCGHQDGSRPYASGSLDLQVTDTPVASSTCYDSPSPMRVGVPDMPLADTGSDSSCFDLPAEKNFLRTASVSSSLQELVRSLKGNSLSDEAASQVIKLVAGRRTSSTPSEFSAQNFSTTASSAGDDLFSSSRQSSIDFGNYTRQGSVNSNNYYGPQQSYVDVNDSTRQSSIDFNGSTRQSGVNFSGSTRQSGVNFSGSTRQSGVNFNGSTRQSGTNYDSYGALHQNGSNFNNGSGSGGGSGNASIRARKEQLQGGKTGFDLEAAAVVQKPPLREKRKLSASGSKSQLKHMDHVEESLDDSFITPTIHAPVQRSGTGEGVRMIVNGSRGSPIPQMYSCSGGEMEEGDNFESGFEDTSGDFEGATTASSNNSVGGGGARSGSDEDEGHISYPVQRNYSVDNGSKDKLLFGRGSISVASAKQLATFNLLQSFNHRQNQGHCSQGSKRCNGPDDLVPTHPIGTGGIRVGENEFYRTWSGSGSDGQPSSSGGSSMSVEEDRNITGECLLPEGNFPDPEASLLPMFPQRSRLPQSESSTIGGGESSSNLAESASSSGTILNPSSEPQTPNYLRDGTSEKEKKGNSTTTRYDFSCVPGEDAELQSSSSPNFEFSGRKYSELADKADGLLTGRRDGNALLPPGSMPSDKHDGSGLLSDAPVLDPHIFASMSDSEASASFVSSHTREHSSSSVGGFELDEPSSSAPARRQGVHDEPPEDIAAMCGRIDEIQAQNKDDLDMMRNRRTLMIQQRPLLPLAHEMTGAEYRAREAESQPVSENWHVDGDVPQEEGELPLRFYDRERNAYKDSLTPVNPDQVAMEEVNHREYLRKYLMGQFHCQRVYREGTHWQRGSPLGRGGQATCYSILDKNTRLALALKEELENDKSLDEAYVCLKLAYEFNVSRNIVEYFSAALLPKCRPKPSIVQLFMEIMPTNMQSYLHRNGPLPMPDVHHFAFQLFDALEFLHNRERIIHCDIKPANLLVDYTAQHLKLADFGAAEMLDKKHSLGDQRSSSNGGGTLHYNPPEYYSGGGESSFALDQWQAGCCVMAMCTGRRPWRHLYMDPIQRKNIPLHDLPLYRRSFAALKKHYACVIGKEVKGHVVPSFVDSGIKKLLHGCLNPDPSTRLTAVDCRQLLAFCEEMSEDQKTTVLEAIGCPSVVPEVLLTFNPSSPRVDVFLGCHYKEVWFKDHAHTLYPGWLGSLPVAPGTTYQDLPLYTSFPVLSHLPPMELYLWAGSPQEFFVSTNLDHQSSGQCHAHFTQVVSRKQAVDPSKAIILFQ